MEVLRVIGSMAPSSGGPCQGLRNLIPELNKLGVNNEVVCLNDPSSTFLEKDSFKVHALGPGKGPWNYSSKLFQWLVGNINRFDVVIIHGLWLYNSYGTYRIWKKFKKENKIVPKLYVMPHGMLDPYFQKAKSRSLKAIRNWIFWKIIENKIVNNADGLLFTCEQELLLARESFHPYSPKAEINIGYGVQLPPKPDENNTQEFLRKCPKIAGRQYLLFLSRIHPKKGVDDLIRAYKLLSKERDNVPHLIIAGPGVDTNFGKEMQNLAVNYPVYFPGMLEGPAKWGALYGCNAFILPSHQENFGIAVVEALACKKAVLITNKVNIYREIENGRCGLVADDSFTGIKYLLEKWIKMSEEEKNRIGEKAGELYHSKFGIGPAAVKFQELIGSEHISCS